MSVGAGVGNLRFLCGSGVDGRAGDRHVRAMLRKVMTVETRFQPLEIWRSDQAVEFRVAGAVHAWHHESRFLTGQAWDLIAASALLRKAGPPKSVLMLGLAGGTTFRTLRHLLPDCRLTAVDIDAEIVALARVHMDLDACGSEVVIDDAYGWLARNERKFDVVIDDIYLAGRDDVFRPQGAGEGTLGLLRRAVADGGIFAMNLVTGEGHRQVQSAARVMLREAFPTVRSLRTKEAQNEVLVAGAEVGTGRALGVYESMFGHSGDRALWKRIRVRKLG
jgi:spermidine synthase